MGPNDWAAVGLIITLLSGWMAVLHRKLMSMTDLSERFVPRPQVDKRFYELEQRLHEDMKAQEGRSDKRFDKIDATLVRIEGKIDSKADK
jgi:DNA primase large subunit